MKLLLYYYTLEGGYYFGRENRLLLTTISPHTTKMATGLHLEQYLESKFMAFMNWIRNSGDSHPFAEGLYIRHGSNVGLYRVGKEVK